LPAGDGLLQGRLLLQQDLGLFGIVPEIRAGTDLIDLFDPFTLGIEVKDASG